MQAILFYLTYPFIYLIALLPFRTLYIVSDLLFIILWLSGYRRSVVMNNLRNSFPEKSEKEIFVLCQQYYRYLCDLILETLKTLKMPEHISRDRCVLHQQPWLTRMYEDHRSMIIVMGHYGNWEWAGPGFALHTRFPLVVIYRPLSNPYFDKMMTTTRTRFGTRITAEEKVLRDMVARNKEVSATAFIADQTPSDIRNAYWTNFLNQDTPVHTGPEKIARKFNYPVVYMNVKRISRGYYEIFPELLSDNPKETAEGEISEAFIRRLEQEITSDPVPWLWSHRRWKHKRPVG
ncbi:MAG: lysophospholipid acyltransferase family protein [Cyclobacteriaceae bacterium]|nr:lysophospholipid acyltransferase family protein [Cyclobacteriaceae bacterium]